MSERLNELPENAAVVGTAIADIFGGPGEDAGLSYLKTLKDIDLQHKVVATEIGQAQGELASALTELNTVASRTFDGINEYPGYFSRQAAFRGRYRQGDQERQ